MSDRFTITHLKPGEKFITHQRVEIEIIDISITSFHMREPTTWVRYKYNTPNGNSGIEENTVKVCQELFNGRP